MRESFSSYILCVYVSVKNLNTINSFLQNKEERFSDKEVKKLIGRVKGDVTK